jgi:hypothetical protein
MAADAQPDQIPTEAEILKDVKVPAGFDATIFAAPPMANYPVFIAAAPNGTLYVSSDGNGSLGRDPHRGRILRLRDLDGDGRADIWRSHLDGLASIANYMRDAGWKPSVPWGVAVRVPVTLNRAALRSTITAPKCPQVYKRHTRWLTTREWRALGVVPQSRGLPDSEMATLLEPETGSGEGYLLTTNYRAILDYNCSNFYAISVGVLADEIARR